MANILKYTQQGEVMFTLFFVLVTTDQLDKPFTLTNYNLYLVVRRRHYYEKHYQYICLDVLRLFIYLVAIPVVISFMALILTDMLMTDFIDIAKTLLGIYKVLLTIFLALDVLQNALFFNKRILISRLKVGSGTRYRASLYGQSGKLANIIADKSSKELALEALKTALFKKRFWYRFTTFDVIYDLPNAVGNIMSQEITYRR